MEGSGSALLSELCAKLATTKVKFAHAEFFEECGGCPASDGALDYAGSDSAAFFVYELSAKRFNIENSGESLSRAHRATKHGPAEGQPFSISFLCRSALLRDLTYQSRTHQQQQLLLGKHGEATTHQSKRAHSNIRLQQFITWEENYDKR